MLKFNPQEKFLGGFLVYVKIYFDICNVIKRKDYDIFMFIFYTLVFVPYNSV